jgi:membrane-bound ClpP family serine protease
MENEVKESGLVKGLGIGSLVLGILAAVVSFIPCFGMYAVFIGAAALVLAIVGLVMSSKSKSPKGLLIAGLVCAAVGVGIGAFQYFALTKAADTMSDPAFRDSLMNSIDTNQINEGLEQLNDQLDSLKSAQ